MNDLTRRAVTACVRSAEELNVLLCLARHRDRYFSPDAVAADTGISRAQAAVALEALASRNLLDVRIADAVLYRLDPSSSRREQVDRTLEAAWRSRAAVLQIVLVTS